MSGALSTLPAADAEAIRGLIAEFHYLIDQGRASECLSLLAAGAKLIFGPGSPNPGAIEGLEAIGSFLVTRQAAPITTRHLLGATRFSVLEDGRVETSTLITLFKSPADNPNVPAAVADLNEIYVHTADGWRLSVREVTPVAWS